MIDIHFIINYFDLPLFHHFSASHPGVDSEMFINKESDFYAFKQFNRDGIFIFFNQLNPLVLINRKSIYFYPLELTNNEY